MSKKKEIRETHYLSDDPVGEDELGPHKAVAQAITDVVLNEKGGKAIALTGSWGSGKSTVVQLIKDKLHRTSNPDATKVFEFDAWGHEGDPLRRIFLEKLIDKASKEFKWVHKDTWKKEKDKLSKQQKTTNSASWPVPTFPAIALAITIFISAAAIALINQRTEAPWYAWFAALCPVIVLVILGIGMFGEARLSKSQDKSESSNITGNNKNKRSRFAVGVNQTGTTTWTETTETPGPTSIEFQDKYHDLLEEALAQHENRKLLIVVDNLDRVDPYDALNIWATMRTFLEFNDQKEEEWQKRVWLLVPYDPSALNKLWISYSNNDIGLFDDALPLLNNFDNEQDTTESNIENELVTAFTEKTFQITFHLPPPVLTKTHDYLESQFKIAFPWHNNSDEFHKIYRIFIVKEVPEDRSVVPRDIKIFINRIVSIYRQIGEEVPLPVQALYAAIAKGSWRGEAELLRPEQIKKNIEIELRGLDWEDGLAAIYFNVDKDHARQLLLGPRIEKTIYAGDVDGLKKLQKSSGFAFVCESVLSKTNRIYAKDEPSSIGMAAFAFGQLEKNDSECPERGCQEVCWDSLVEGAAEIFDWRRLNENISTGIVNLLHHRRSESFYSKLIESLSRTDPEMESDNNEAIPLIKPWLQSLSVILKKMNTEFPEIAKQFRMGGIEGHYIEAMKIASNNDEYSKIAHLLLPKRPQRIQELLISLAGQGHFDDDWSKLIELLKKNDVITDIDSILKGIIAFIKGDQTRDHQKWIAAVSILQSLAEDVPFAGDAMSKLTKEGPVKEYLNFNEPVPNPMVAAVCILLIHRYFSEFSGSFKDCAGPDQGHNVYLKLMREPGLNAPAKETVVEYANLLISWDLLPVLFKLNYKYPNVAFVLATLKEVSTNENAHKLISPDIIIDNHDFIRNALTPELYYNLLRASVEDSSLMEAIVNTPFDCRMSFLYEAIHHISYEDRQYKDTEYVDYLVLGLRSISDENWNGEFPDVPSGRPRIQRDILNLLMNVTMKRNPVNLGQHFKMLLLKHSKIWQSEQAIPGEIEGNGDKLVRALAPDFRATFLLEMKEIIDNPDEPSDILEKLYSDIIEESAY